MARFKQPSLFPSLSFFPKVKTPTRRVRKTAVVQPGLFGDLPFLKVRRPQATQSKPVPKMVQTGRTRYRLRGGEQKKVPLSIDRLSFRASQSKLMRRRAG